MIDHIWATPKERRAVGRAWRKQVRRRSHGEWSAPADRPDPIAILEQQGVARVQELLPIRYGRMSLSAFSFYRGAAAVMAWDLAHSPTSGIEAQLCGDAHLSNFGVFATPERRMIFDIDDFDETHSGPFEWDLKRLAASIAIACEDNGLSGREARAAVRATVSRYREAIADLATRRFLDVWYAGLDVGRAMEVMERAGKSDRAIERRLRRARKRLRKAATKRTNIGALERFAERGPDGGWRIRADPPLIVPAPGDEQTLAVWRRVFEDYTATVRPEVRTVLERYRFVDGARKVVGVGSVGTDAFMALLIGTTDEDPLFLQLKEAMPSVLEPYTRATAYGSEGERVVRSQRLIQAASDPFLGWVVEAGPRRRDYYVRQLRDGKLSAEVERMGAGELALYGAMCGGTLARAHARTGDAAEIAGYLGKGEAFVDAMVSFAGAYAAQNARDHEALLAAIEAGRVEATPDI